MADKVTCLMLTDDLMEDNATFSSQQDESEVLFFFLAVVASILRIPRISIPEYVHQIVPLYMLDDFRRFFRMCRQTFEAICRIVAPSFLPTTEGGRKPIPFETQLLSIFWFLGSQDTFHRIADRFDMAESSFSRIRSRFFQVVINDLPKYIQWPSAQERLDIAAEFERRKGFPGIIGAIDGTHIPICAPSGDDSQSYVNRKKFHSLVLQGVCRHDMRFIHCSTGYPGSVHDAKVLRRSDLWENGLAMCGRGYLIGNGAYPCKRWLMTPYRNNGHLTRQQVHFNYCLSNSRSCVERAFGLLKGRFRRLSKVSTLEVSTACNIIMVSCILHNAVLIAGDDFEDFINDFLYQDI